MQAQLTANNAEFRVTILNWMDSKVPITETQTSLRSILASHPVLQEQYSSFLMHSTTTPEECEAARQELGKLMGIQVYDFLPGAPTYDEIVALGEALQVC